MRSLLGFLKGLLYVLFKGGFTGGVSSVNTLPSISSFDLEYARTVVGWDFEGDFLPRRRRRNFMLLRGGKKNG